MTAPIHLIRDRLEQGGWRPFGPDEKFRALCPGHQDRSNPALVVSERSDGSVGVACFTGCTAEQVVSALGLRLADLFVPTDRPLPRIKPRERPDPTWVRIWRHFDGAITPTPTLHFWLATCSCGGQVWVHAAESEEAHATDPWVVSCEGGCDFSALTAHRTSIVEKKELSCP